MSRSRTIMLGILCSFLYQNALVKAADVALFNLTDFSMGVKSENGSKKKAFLRKREGFVFRSLDQDSKIVFTKLIPGDKKHKVSYKGNEIDIRSDDGNFLVLVYGFGLPGKYVKIKLEDNEEDRRFLKAVEEACRIASNMIDFEKILQKRAANQKERSIELFKKVLNLEETKQKEALCQILMTNLILLNNIQKNIFEKGRFQFRDFYGNLIRKFDKYMLVCERFVFNRKEKAIIERVKGIKQKLGIIPKGPPAPPPPAGLEMFNKKKMERRKARATELQKTREEEKIRREKEAAKTGKTLQETLLEALKKRIENIKGKVEEKIEKSEDSTWEDDEEEDEEEEEES